MDANTAHLHVQACVRTGRAGMAATLYEQMSKSGVRPDGVTRTTLVRAHCAAGDLQTAMATLVDMEVCLRLTCCIMHIYHVFDGRTALYAFRRRTAWHSVYILA
jgi:pentatricopeptide repeat protein